MLYRLQENLGPWDTTLGTGRPLALVASTLWYALSRRSKHLKQGESKARVGVWVTHLPLFFAVMVRACI